MNIPTRIAGAATLPLSTTRNHLGISELQRFKANLFVKIKKQIGIQKRLRMADMEIG